MVPPYALLRASVDGGSVQTGGITASLGASIQLSASSAGLPGATQVRYEIYGYPEGFALPAGWTDLNGTYYYIGVTPPAFLVTPWGKYMLRLRLNNGISNVASIPSEQLTDDSTAISVVSPNGLEDVGAWEATQFSTIGWVRALQNDLRALDTELGTTATNLLAPAKAAATANVASLSGTGTFDGVALGVNDRIFLPFQTTASQNGPWLVKSGAWVRPPDFDQNSDVVAGQMITISEGTTLSGHAFVLKGPGPYTLGTTALNWVDNSVTSIGSANFVLTTNAAGTAQQWRQLVDANISATAAIAGTKITPDFGAQNITTTGNLLLGPTTTPRSATGLIRVAHNQTILRGRNSGNTVDSSLIRWGSPDDTLIIGDGNQGGLTAIDANVSAGVQLRTNGSTRFAINNLWAQFNVNLVQFSNASITAPVITIATAGVAGFDISVRGQSSTLTNNDGRHLLLQGGARTGTGRSGSVRLQLNDSDTNFQTLIGIAEVAASRRVVSMALGADITTTQMPANTGDLVIFVGNAATIPSADAVGGFINYGDGGKPAWRFNATNLRIDGTSASASAGAGSAAPGTVEGYLAVTINGTARKIPYFAN